MSTSFRITRHSQLVVTNHESPTSERWEVEPRADRSVQPRLVRRLVELVVRIDRAARHHPDFADELENEEIHRQVGEVARSREILLHMNRRAPGTAEPTELRASVHVPPRVVCILTDAGSDV